MTTTIPKTRNKFERRIFNELKKAKVEFGYETVKIPYVLVGNYTPDFTLSNGIHIECKGYFRPEDKRKIKAVKLSNQSCDLRLVFYEHKKKNIKWAEKNGFPWAVGSIPEEWLTCHGS